MKKLPDLEINISCYAKQNSVYKAYISKTIMSLIIQANWYFAFIENAWCYIFLNTFFFVFSKHFFLQTQFCSNCLSKF